MKLLERLTGRATTRSDTDRPLQGVQILDGPIELEVVGESHYQENLLRIVPRTANAIRVETLGVLLAERDNHYDPDAISIWIHDLEVGYLSRADAALYRPGLLKLEGRYRKAIALRGVIAGRDILGVFLRHDPTDFGVVARPTSGGASTGAHPRIRTGETDAIATDDLDDSYDLAWIGALPASTQDRIPALHALLDHTQEAMERHFMYHELEAALYKSRNARPDALGEFDEACRHHDAEMDRIRAEFLRKWNGVPWLQTYRQMCIREAKVGDYERALWWAKRGLSIYGANALRPDAVEDLQRRADECAAHLANGPRRPTPTHAHVTGSEALKCVVCGRIFERLTVAGRKPTRCPTCRHAPPTV